MALSTYAELKSSIADHLDRDDLTDQIDDFIVLVEARHKREIRIRDMLVREPLTITDSNRYASVPTGYLEAEILRILTDASGNEVDDHIVEFTNVHELTRRRKSDTNEARPKLFTVHADIEFEASPDQNYGAELIYYAPLTALSDANPANALLTLAPDAYLYGALAASAPWLLHDERLAVWGDLYGVARDQVNSLTIRARNVGQLRSRVAGSTP